MAVDMFIKIKDIDGESKDDKHKDWIDVLSWSWGMDNPGRAAAGGGRGGRVNIQDLSFSHPLDKASPHLMLHCANGKHIEDVVLAVRKAGVEQTVDYYIITMERVKVTSVSLGSASGDIDPVEDVTLNFSEVKVKYTEQDDKGRVGGIHEFGWNVATNKPS